MPINVNCCLDGSMAHLLFDIMQGLSLLEQERRKGMPYVVKTDGG